MAVPAEALRSHVERLGNKGSANAPLSSLAAGLESGRDGSGLWSRAADPATPGCAAAYATRCARYQQSAPACTGVACRRAGPPPSRRQTWVATTAGNSGDGRCAPGLQRAGSAPSHREDSCNSASGPLKHNLITRS